MSTTRRTLLAGLAALPAVPASALTTHPDAVLIARRAEVDAVNARCKAAYQRHTIAERLKFAGKPAPDHDAAEAAVDAAEAAWFALHRELVDIPARTVAGLKVKILACGGDPEMSPTMMASIAADILAMEGAAA